MKILIINTFYYPDLIGGAEHSVQNLAESLVEKGHEVFVLCFGNEKEKVNINGVNVLRNISNNVYSPFENMKQQPFMPKLIYRSLDLFGFLNKNMLTKEIKLVNPDIIHINNFPGFGLGLFQIINKLKIPFIFTARDYYTVCPKATLVNSDNYNCESCKKVCNFYRLVNSKSLNKCNLITAPSQFMLDKLNNHLDLEQSKLKLIPNSIDIDETFIENTYQMKKKNLENKQLLKLVFLGRLESHKGLNILLDFFKRMNDSTFELHIAGEGPLRDEVEKNVHKNIFYYGKLGREQLNQLLIETDIMVAPSLWYEPFGRIVIDAYKYSMPVITTGMGGLGEIVIEGKTGSIIDFYNYNEFKECLHKYLDKELLLTQMKNCKEESLRYSNEKVRDYYLQIYEEIL